MKKEGYQPTHRPRGPAPIDPDSEEPEVTPPTDAELAPPLRVWITGEAIIATDDTDKRIAKDWLHKYAPVVGLTVNEQIIHNEEIPSRHYRRFSFKRMSNEGVLEAIANNPGSTIAQLAVILYGEQQTERTMMAATNRLRAALFRLKGRYIARHQQGGAKQFFPTEPVRDQVQKARTQYMEKKLLAKFSKILSLEEATAIASYIADEMARAEPQRTYIPPAELRAMVGTNLESFRANLGKSPGAIRMMMEEVGAQGAREVARVLDALPPPLTTDIRYPKRSK